MQMQVDKSNGRSFYVDLIYTFSKVCWMVVVMTGCTKQLLTMRTSAQFDKQVSHQDQKDAEIPADEKSTCECEGGYFQFPILGINDIMLLPSSKFAEVVKLLSQKDNKCLSAYLVTLTKNTFAQLRKEILFKVPEKVSQKRIDFEIVMNIIEEFVGNKSFSLVSKAMQHNTMTYGEYIWKLEKRGKSSLIMGIKKELHKKGFYSVDVVGADVIKSKCEFCPKFDRNREKVDQVISHSWKNEAIASRMLMNLFVNDRKERTTDGNDQSSVCSYIVPYSISQDILDALCDALENQPIAEVTEKYEKFLMDSMIAAASGSAGIPDIKTVLAQSPSNKAEESIDELCAKIEGGIEAKQNQPTRSTAGKPKKKRLPKSKEWSPSKKESTSKATIDSDFLEQVEQPNLTQFLEAKPTVKYRIHPRVKKWSNSPLWLLKYFQCALENSYDGQFKYINDLERIIEEKIKHDITPIQNLLMVEDVGNYFIHRGNTRTASVLVENQSIKKHGMLDIAISADDTIYHQAIRFQSVEKTFCLPKYSDSEDKAAQGANCDQYESQGRRIYKDPITQAYILNIGGKDKGKGGFANKLATCIHVLPFRMPIP